MRVLATGGAGYVGSAAVRLLQKRGHFVKVYDNLSKGHRQAIPADCLIVADLADGEKLCQVLRQNRIEAVIHFAGSTAVGESVENPRLYYRNNVANSLVLLEAMLDTQVKFIIFSSTAAVYAPQNIPLREESPLSPSSPYAVSKYIMERMIEHYAAAYHWGYTILRYFNACGASPDGKYGEDHQPETHLIPLVLQTALGRREKLSILGGDYDTADGTCIRDYVHVDDLAEAHVLALEALQGGNGGVYNIGTGRGCSVLEVIQAAEQIVKFKIVVEMKGRRAGDTSKLVAAADLIKSRLGWHPKYENINDIIASAWQWHRQNPQGYPPAEEQVL